MQTVLFINERGQILITHDAPIAGAPRDLLWNAGRVAVRLADGGTIEIGRDPAPDMAAALDAAGTALLIEMRNDAPAAGIDLRIVKQEG